MDKFVVRIDAELEDLIPGYLDNRREDIRQIEQCLEKGDFETIRRLAHRMKGSGGGYGFDRITEIGAAMEQAAIQAHAVKTREQLELLRDYLVRVEIVYV
ncbi:MAG: Hpt domain-containing protein [Bacillota bacterium]